MDGDDLIVFATGRTGRLPPIKHRRLVDVLAYAERILLNGATQVRVGATEDVAQPFEDWRRRPEVVSLRWAEPRER